jgi:Transglycosylase SLT domain
VRPRGLLLCAALWAAASGAQAQIYTRVNGNGVIEATNVPDDPGFRLTYPGKGTLIHSRGFRMAYHGEYDNHILDAGAAHGVSSELIKAVIQVESEFDRLAVSSKGAQGLMQLMPFTARHFGVADPFDPRQNIFGGVQYLRFLLDMFNGNVALALAGYNAGENAVTRYGGVPPYRETRNYVDKIQSILGGGGVRLVSGSATPITGYAPSPTAITGYAPSRPAHKPSKLLPARPQTYFKWRDERGSLHVASGPPPEGIVYSTIRALD